jgi:hypothetical protein
LAHWRIVGYQSAQQRTVNVGMDEPQSARFGDGIDGVPVPTLSIIGLFHFLDIRNHENRPGGQILPRLGARSEEPHSRDHFRKHAPSG